MTVYSDELRFWRKNKEWYGIKPNGEFYLKDKAPKEAVESFKKFKEYFKNR
jgi:hypothetical protein